MGNSGSSITFQFCGPETPQLIVLDSHSSHDTLGLIEAARDENIVLFALPPHTTQWLCPLDKSVFSPLSREYNRVCSEFMSVSTNNLVCKWEWPRLFNLAYKAAFTEKNIQSGFQKCGIYPLDKASIPESAYAPSKPFDTSREGAMTKTAGMSTLNKLVACQPKIKFTWKKLSPTTTLVRSDTELSSPEQSTRTTCSETASSCVPGRSSSPTSIIPILSNDVDVIAGPEDVTQEADQSTLLNMSISDLLPSNGLLNYLGGDV